MLELGFDKDILFKIETCPVYLPLFPSLKSTFPSRPLIYFVLDEIHETTQSKSIV